MKSRQKIETEYKKKIKKLLSLNKAYFDKDKPKASDFEFDNLKRELIELSNKHPFLKKIKANQILTKLLINGAL